MSYILDALRRADSERERGTIPTLNANARSMSSGEEEGEATRGQFKLLVWAVIAMAVALAAVLAWQITTPAPQPVLIAPPVAAAMPDSRVATQAVAPSPAPAVLATPAMPPVVPRSESQSRVEVDAEERLASARAEKPKRRMQATEEPSDASAPPQPKPKAAAKPAVEDKPAPKLSELSDDIRRQLPTLTVGGASYSENPSRRMLILNGQVFREGDAVAANLRLIHIQLKSAVLDFKGQRYSISF